MTTMTFLSRRVIAGAAIVVAGIGVACGGAGAANAASPSAASLPSTISFGYQGVPVIFTVPDGVANLGVDAVGGAGGSWGFQHNYGAEVHGTLTVTPGEELRVSVGGKGGDASSSTHDIPGGWGGMGANGGVGNGAKSDYLRSGGAGGGATTLEALIDGVWQPVLIAGGAGGDGGPSGDRVTDNSGGGGGWSHYGGCTVTDASWSGAAGRSGSIKGGGTGGASAAEPGMVGARGQGGHGLGGNGGGGGGGFAGGAGGGGASGTSSGGGGGAGASVSYLLQGVTVTNPMCYLSLLVGDNTLRARLTLTPVS